MSPFESCCIFGTRTGPQLLLILLLLMLLLGATLFEKSLRLRFLLFESDRHEIWQDDFRRYSSSTHVAWRCPIFCFRFRGNVQAILVCTRKIIISLIFTDKPQPQKQPWTSGLTVKFWLNKWLAISLQYNCFDDSFEDFETKKARVSEKEQLS